MADLENDVTMTPHEIAEQTQSPENWPTHTFNGLALHPSPWTEGTSSSEKESSGEKTKKTKRQMLEEKILQEQREKNKKDNGEIKQRYYLAEVAASNLRAKTQGASMDPEEVGKMLHMGASILSGGMGPDFGDMIEDAANKDDKEEKNRPEATSEPEQDTETPAPPLREN